MTTVPTIKQITLAVENPGHEQVARNMCAGFLPDCDIALTSLTDFAESLDSVADPSELKVLLLQADEHDRLGAGLPIVHGLMQSQAPVLVTRWNGKDPAPVMDIRRVVVPLDGSTVAGQAIPIASRVARVLNVPVRFIMVIDPSRVIPPAYAYDPDAWGMIEELRQTSHWALSQAEASMRNDGIEVESDLLFGPINASFLSRIVEGDLVVMTTHGLNRPAVRSRESVAMRTLVSIAQPMLIMQASNESPVVVDGYLACSWVEPLQPSATRMP